MKGIRTLILTLILGMAFSAGAQTNFQNIVEACRCAVSAFKDGGSRKEMQRAYDLLSAATYDKLGLVGVSTADACPLDGRLIFAPNFFRDYMREIHKLAREYENETRGTGGKQAYLTTVGIKKKGTVSHKMICNGRLKTDIHCIAEVGRKINMTVKYRPVGSKGEYTVLKENVAQSAGLHERSFYDIDFSSDKQQEVIIEVTNKSNKPTSVAYIVNVK